MTAKETPLVTVYITNYNYGRYIRKAIESVLNQTLQDFEIIIIDDGSTDNSQEIIESYSPHPKIKVIFQKNRGLTISNNIAIRIARGKYIMRLDADDYLDSNALLIMSTLLEKDDNLGLIFPNYYYVSADGTILGIQKRHSFDKDVSLYDQPANGACTMIRRDFFMNLGGYDEQFTCQDGYELWIKFVSKYKVTNVDTPLFYYRQHGSNLTLNEKRILDTRAKINEKYVRNINLLEKTSVIAIIPVRGANFDVNSVALTKLGDKYILDWKIEEALKAKTASLVLISSPDEDIEHHVLNKCRTNDKIIFHKRKGKLARLNVDLVDTINNILYDSKLIKQLPQIIVVLSIEYPFVTGKTIDDAIHTLKIFKADSLISVRPDASLFYQHHGDGMKAILNQEKFTRLEREALYKYGGGITVVTTSYFIENQKLIGGKVGHIIVNQRSSHIIKTKYDLEIAKYLITIDDRL